LQRVALSFEDSTAIDVGSAKSMSGRPTVSVVLLASGEAESLDRALSVLTPACREFGARLVVIWPEGRAGPPAPEASDVELVTVLVSPDSTSAERRALAARGCATDLMIFADEERAVGLPWADVLAVRLVFARGSEAEGTRHDWRAVLARLGVPLTDRG
jgi:hypothetical protein